MKIKFSPKLKKSLEKSIVKHIDYPIVAEVQALRIAKGTDTLELSAAFFLTEDNDEFFTDCYIQEPIGEADFYTMRAKLEAEVTRLMNTDERKADLKMVKERAEARRERRKSQEKLDLDYHWNDDFYDIINDP